MVFIRSALMVNHVTRRTTELKNFIIQINTKQNFAPHILMVRTRNATMGSFARLHIVKGSFL